MRMKLPAFDQPTMRGFSPVRTFVGRARARMMPSRMTSGAAASQGRVPKYHSIAAMVKNRARSTTGSIHSPNSLWTW